jgi:hypothetical protein
MNTTLLLSLLIPSLSLAEPLENPCSKMACTPTMAGISEEYRAAGGIGLNQLPILASGECFHSSPNHDPERRQFGYLLLDSFDGVAYQSGTFSFFEAGNTYEKLTMEEARKLQPSRFAEHRLMDLQPDYAFTDMNKADPTMPWKYWLKQTAEKFYVSGQWGPKHRFLCRFQKHL